jgi:ABC-type glycerol-3-phosphate transport system substrate-binding protein
MRLSRTLALAAAILVLPALTLSAADKVNLNYWSMWNQNEPQAQVIQDWINGFQAANPNITIKATWNGRQNQTLLRTALNAGTKVDLMDQDADQVAGGLVAAGQAYPLNDLLKEKAADEAGTVESTFVPGVVHMFDVNGKTYLWPYVYNTAQFFYSQALFDKYKLTAPKTWDDFLKVADTLKKAGVPPLAVESDIQGYNAVYFTYLVARLKGPGFLTKAANDKTGALWKDPAILKAAKMEQDLWTRGAIPAESKGYKWPQGQQTLAGGESAMELVGSWLPTELAPATGPDFAWGGFAFPEVAGGQGKGGDLLAFMLSFMIPKNADHPKEAGAFLKYTMTKANQQAMVTKGNVGVTRKGINWPANIAGAQKAAETANVVFGEGDGLQGSNADLWVNVIRNPHNDMFVGLITPEAFVDKLVTGTANFWKGKK